MLDLADARVHPEAQLRNRFSALESRVTEIESGVRHNGDMLRALLKRSVEQVEEGQV